MKQVTCRKPSGEVARHGRNHVLAQYDRHWHPKRYSLAVVRDARFKDVEIQVRMKTETKKQRPKAGVVWRYQNSENHLVACVDFSAGRIQLYRVVKGNHILLGSGESLKVPPEKWHTLKVQHRDDRIKVYLNGEAFLIEEDQYYVKKGKVGLWTQTNGAIYFDDLQANELEPRK